MTINCEKLLNAVQHSSLLAIGGIVYSQHDMKALMNTTDLFFALREANLILKKGKIERLDSGGSPKWGLNLV